MPKDEIIFCSQTRYQLFERDVAVTSMFDLWEACAQEAVARGYATWVKTGYSVLMDIDRFEIRHIPMAKADPKEPL